MIKIESLSKKYGGRTVVDDVTFTARPGRVTGFLGPNGAGKIARPTTVTETSCWHQRTQTPET